jgi:hypothetical protein
VAKTPTAILIVSTAQATISRQSHSGNLTLRSSYMRHVIISAIYKHNQDFMQASLRLIAEGI